MEEDLKTVQEIKKTIVSMLNAKYGYCGCAEGENFLMLNSGKTNIVIKIEVKD